MIKVNRKSHQSWEALLFGKDLDFWVKKKGFWQEALLLGALYAVA
jgi:hypothetical protein